MKVNAKVLIEQLYQEIQSASERSRAADLAEDYYAVCSENGCVEGLQRALHLVDRLICD